MSGATDAKEIWKRLFFLVVNNEESDDDLPSMWTQFKRKQLNTSDIEAAIRSIKDQLEENVKVKLESLLGEEGITGARILDSMKGCFLLGDDFWRLLFTAIRDRESHPIGNDMTVPILEGGQTKHMTIEEIEEKFFSENPNILKSFTSVPDQMIHEDLIDAHLNTTSLEKSLRETYEN